MSHSRVEIISARTSTRWVPPRFASTWLPHFGVRPQMADQNAASMPSALPMAPQSELPISVTDDSVVTKCSPRTSSQPVR